MPLPLFPLQLLVDCCFPAAVAVAATTVAVAVVITAVTITAVSITTAVAVASVTAVVVAATNVSRHPLTAPPSCCLAQAGCCVASCRNALLSSCCATLLSYRCPLTAPPSRCLISLAGCCVASHCIPFHCPLTPPLLSSCAG